MSTHHPTFGRGRNSGLGSVFKSFTSSLKSTRDVPVQINPTVVGGGSDLRKLLVQLQSGPLPQRASTAAKLTESLKKFSTSSIPEIWYLAKDMCDPRIQSYIRRVALQLMCQCIKNDDLSSTSNKLMYYKDIITYCSISDYKLDQEFDLFLTALQNLTQDGRDIQDLCLYEDGINLPKLLSTGLTVFGKTAKSFNKMTVEELNDDIHYDNLSKLLTLTKNCIKFNAPMIDEMFLNSFIRSAIYIPQKCTDIGLLSQCIDILTHTVIYSNISHELLYDSVRFLCSVYGVDDKVTELTWNAMTVLTSHGTFFAVGNCLKDTITDVDIQSFRNTEPENALTTVTSNTTISTADHKQSNLSLSACIGAIQIIERLTTSPFTNPHDTPLLYFLQSLVQMATFNVPTVNTALLRSLDRVFSATSNMTSNDIDINRAMEQVYSFQLWYSSKGSIYDLLNAIKISSEIDVSYWKSICHSLQKSYENHELTTPKEKLINLFTNNYQFLSSHTIKFVLRFYIEEQLLTVLNPFAREHTTKILNYFFHGNQVQTEITRAEAEGLPEVRLEVLKSIKNALDVSYSIERTDFNFELVIDLLKRSIAETDEQVLNYFFVEIFSKSVNKASQPILAMSMDILSPYFEVKTAGRLRSLVSLTSSTARTSQTSNETYQNTKMSKQFKTEAAKAFMRILIAESTRNASKASEAFRICVVIAQHALSTDNSDLLLIMLKGFVRIRVSTENCLYFTNPSEMEGLANAFGRNTLDSDFKPSSTFKWSYPEKIDFIDEKYYDKPLQDLKPFNSQNFKLDLSGTETIDIDIWFSIVLDILNNFFDWEVYSFILAHFCPQLANIQLFINSPDQVLLLKKVLCEQLMLNLPNGCTLPEGFTKSHLQVAFVRTFSALLGYHELFSKYDEDDIIRSLLFGIDSWERTAIPCIHILTVFCHEIPLSIKKYLSTILTKFQTKVTSVFASSHILEFLMALVNVDSLTSSLNSDDAKRIFGIASKFISHSTDALRNRESTFNGKMPQYGSDITIDQTPSTQQSQENSHILFQYVLTLSYNVISTWFLKLDMNVRKKLSSFILKNLVSVNTGNKELDEQVTAYVDLIIRFTYNDLPLKIVNPKTALDTMKSNDNTSTCSWILGSTITTICTNTETGDSMVIFRRPTGVTIIHVSLDESLFSQGSKYLRNTIVSPNHIFLQGMNNIEPTHKPIPLIEDSAITRAIGTLDRIPIVEFHKIGVSYIGRNQSSESEVLGNRGGSKNYQRFLDNIGHLIKLKNCKDIYVGGLDTENGRDGDYALYWSDKTVQVVYHTTTLMPNNEDDLYFELKKRHIGNNYVNIYFDESGLPFNFNLIKSQFNFINIVVSPHTKSFSFKEDESGGRKYFKVKLFRRSGVPGVFATCHFKIVSEEVLPSLVRGLAITANQFANVWHANFHGKFVSNWAHRVRQIRTIREKTVQTHETMKQEQLNEIEHPGMNDATQSLFEQLEFGSVQKNESSHRYEYLNDDDNEFYAMLEFNSYT